MFYCNSKTSHQHETVLEMKECQGLVPEAVPVVLPSPAPNYRTATPSQLKFIAYLKGDVQYAASLSVADTSTYIKRLKSENNALKLNSQTVQSQAQPQVVQQYARQPASPVDPRFQMVDMMLGLVPDGYYAVRANDTAPYKFIRFTRPTKNKYASCWKFQEQLGSYTGRYELRAVRWPSGKWSSYQPGFVEQIMLIVADHKTAAITYGQEFKRCCRCNADLTDERSRWYSIGPDCEQHWPWVLDTINDSAKGPYVAGRS